MEGLIRQAYRRYDFAVSIAAVVVAAAASIWLTRYGGPLATVWVANGLAIAALMRRGGQSTASFLAIISAIVWLLCVCSGFTVLDAINLTLVNALEVGWVVRMLADGEGVTYLEQPAGVQRFILWAVIVAPLVTSALAAPVHAMETGTSVWLTVGMRWCSHALGNAIAVPLAFGIARWRRIAPLSQRRTRRCLLALLLLALATLGAFVQPEVPGLFVVFPPLVLLAMVGNRRWGIGGVLLVALLGGWLTVIGRGPIAEPETPPALATMQFQLFVLCCIAVTLPLVTSMEQRRRLGHTLRGSEARYRMLAEHSHDLVLLLDAQGYCKYVSPAAYSILGYRPDKLVESSLQSLIDEASLATAVELWRRLINGDHPGTTLLRMRHADGSYRFMEAAGGVIDEEPDRVILTLRDVTARIDAEEALREERHLTDVTLKAIGDAVFTLDGEGRLGFANPAGAALLERSTRPDAEKLEDRLPLWRGSERLSEDHPVRTALHTGAPAGPMLCALELHGEPARAMECSAVPIRNELGGVIGAVFVLHDVSAILALSERMAHLAHFDALTDLPNRPLLLDRLSGALVRARQGAHHLAVLFIDVDRFKQINDTLGHVSGDAVLKQVAERLLSVMAAGDTVARLGGDEFVVLIPEVGDRSAVAACALQALEALSVPMRVGRRELRLTASIGIAMFPDDGDEADLLIRHADMAMYAAKRGGRNDYHFYVASMDAGAQAEFDLENALRAALARSELFLDFQPRIDTSDGRILGAEALLRWRRTDGTVCRPDAFIPIAEASGLILMIGAWVLKEACHACRNWQDGPLHGVGVSVNISQLQFGRENFLQLVMEALREAGLPPQLLELELTESMLMEPTDAVRQRIAGLKSLGVHLSIDDFGTGYSSLAYLRRFAIDTLKIDRSFIADMADDPEDASVIHAIIALAISLGKRVVAEGVETQRQADLLTALGCHEMQGHLYSPPVDARRLAEFAHKRRVSRRDRTA
ncbi:EAL domain-containing protein [Dyella sp. LX-66]|uniref:bifunctional diguanylate cyclase/phosphodiesterase n=1 Tax=unclassified Dyella TaxID=2634549 RepID=UPI001BE0DE3E|nr:MULTISPECIES: EAL domain-containing protein [unclassified Dyella]MBT2117617.1 EAL domain-containing protein [Dyella sp. LX-1]MBT2141379.1 EAL domain-containing protein [Dyella sp. LX-66]